MLKYVFCWKAKHILRRILGNKRKYHILTLRRTTMRVNPEIVKYYMSQYLSKLNNFYLRIKKKFEFFNDYNMYL